MNEQFLQRYAEYLRIVSWPTLRKECHRPRYNANDEVRRSLALAEKARRESVNTESETDR